MIDHISIQVKDYGESLEFYKKTLEPLGYKLEGEYGNFAGLGADGIPDFWIEKGKATNPILHIAFRAKDRAAVQAFHEAAIQAGGTDNGKPGIRKVYHPNYYGAFILDPDGHNIEAVCHHPE